MEQLLRSSQADKGFKEGVKVLRFFQGRTSQDSEGSGRFMSVFSMYSFSDQVPEYVLKSSFLLKRFSKITNCSSFTY